MNNSPPAWRKFCYIDFCYPGGIFMKKLFVVLYALCLVFCISLTAFAVSLSPGLDVIRSSMKMVKTSVGENSVSFTAADFENFLGVKPEKIKIVSLPSEKAGKLMFGEKEVSAGDEIDISSVSALRFVPAAKEVSAGFEFSAGNDDEAFICSVSTLPSLNFAPTVTDGALSVEKEIPCFGTLSSVDKEGDAVTYFLTSEPKHGELTLDNITGKFVYSPDENFSGKDRFRFVAKDYYGNISGEAEIKITVSKNSIKYSDMAGNDAYTAASVLGGKEILLGETIGGEKYFYPEKTVTRGEFLVMAMSALDLPTAEAAATAFADDSDISAYQRKYVTAAVSGGIIFGVDYEDGKRFDGNAPITARQAATIVSRLMSKTSPSLSESLPVAASCGDEVTDEGLAAMASLGYFSGMKADDTLTRADAAKIIYKMMK